MHATKRALPFTPLHNLVQKVYLDSILVLRVEMILYVWASYNHALHNVYLQIDVDI